MATAQSYVASQYRTFESGMYPHVGVEVKTDNGMYCCVHNTGTGNGKAGTTASCSGSENRCGASKNNPWRPAKFRKTIDQLVAAGGSGYSFTKNNCYSARNRILKALTGS